MMGQGGQHNSIINVETLNLGSVRSGAGHFGAGPIVL